ncbi:1-deoxy-D-xylulose-5-phosphate synthase, partial [Clostridium sp. HCS.1]
MFDLSDLSAVPNMTVLAPKHLDEVKIMLNWALNHNGPVALRYPRGGDLCGNLKPLNSIEYGKWERVSDGEKVAIIAVGKMLQYSIIAKEEL